MLNIAATPYVNTSTTDQNGGGINGNGSEHVYDVEIMNVKHIEKETWLYGDSIYSSRIEVIWRMSSISTIPSNIVRQISSARGNKYSR